MNEYHVRLQSAFKVDSAKSDLFINRLLVKLNRCDYYGSIKRFCKEDLELSFTGDGNVLVSFVLYIYKTKHKLKVLDKLLTKLNQSHMILLSFK